MGIKNKSIAYVIDEVTVVITKVRGGQKEVSYHIPQGWSGHNFLSFKTKNKSFIDFLKTKIDGKEESEIKESEFEPIPPDTTFV